MAVPTQLPTAARDETYGGVTYHIEGELVPVLQVELGTVPVYFEHHILLWKDPAVPIGVNVFEAVLGAGEQMDIEPGGWVYKDRTVQMQTMMQSLKAGFFASAGQLVWNRFTGPGRVGLQSMYLHLPTAV